MPVQLVNVQVDLMRVLALWHELMCEWHPEHKEAPLTVPIRRRHAMDSLARHLRADTGTDPSPEEAERACGFDIVLRLASGQIDTMHATNPFFTRGENGQWFTPVDIEVEGRKNPLKGVVLTPAAIALWNDAALAEREQALEYARKLLESDIESQGFVVRLLPKQEAGLATSKPLGETASRKDYLRALVKAIHAEPFQPIYRKRPFGAPVKGWDARLMAYFWPAPQHGYRETSRSMHAFTENAGQLARVLAARGAWNDIEQAQAIELAHAIFAWGGVPQDPETVTPAAVQAVVQAALDNDAGTQARMNSGWTKVAAFATAHQEESAGGRPQVIWDSRVATALISRLDRLLSARADPAILFPGVGTVPGRGGTRPRTLSRRWPSGYRSWAGQVAGSMLVREIRDILNDDGYPMPLPEGGSGKWTARAVEMVLFMDGY